MKYFVDYLPITKENKTTLYTDGKDYCRDLEAELRKARKTVFLTGLHFMADFRLTRPSPALKSNLAQILFEAGDRGVKVYLLVNQFWKDEQEVKHKVAPIRKGIMKGGELHGYLPETYKLFESLGSTASIVCRTDIHPHSGVFGTHHQKTVVIDNKMAFLGGIDLTYLDGDRWDTHDHRVDERAVDRTQKFWHDVHMRLEGPAVEFVRDNFYQRWESGDLHTLEKTWTISADQRAIQIIVGVKDKKRPILPALETTAKYTYPTSKETADTPTVQIVRSMPTNRFYKTHKPTWNKQKEAWEHSCKDAYLLGIRFARKYIYIENQWISDEGMWRELKNAAKRNRDNHDFRIVLMVPYEGLFAAGLGSNQELWIGTEMEEVVEALGSLSRFGMYGLVRRWNRDRSFDQVYVHSKVMIVDDEWSLIGSANAGGISLEGIRTGRDKPDSELSAIILDSGFPPEALVRTPSRQGR
jgi:phosphatidylserine/phosphatidylglycerophosphate/cardiolipin synthase-like enzyme